MMVNRKALTAAALGIVALTGSAVFGTASANAAQPQDIIGCSPGHVCIFSPNPKPIGTLDGTYYYYGVYTFSDEVGTKNVCNQQTGGALVRLYKNYGATGTPAYTIQAGSDNGHGSGCHSINMTPIDSMRLSAN